MTPTRRETDLPEQVPFAGSTCSCPSSKTSGTGQLHLQFDHTSVREKNGVSPVRCSSVLPDGQQMLKESSDDAGNTRSAIWSVFLVVTLLHGPPPPGQQAEINARKQLCGQRAIEVTRLIKAHIVDALLGGENCLGTVALFIH